MASIFQNRIEASNADDLYFKELLEFCQTLNLSLENHDELTKRIVETRRLTRYSVIDFPMGEK